jgi:hypothetical protein
MVLKLRNVVSRLGVTYNMGFDWMIGFIAPYTLTTRDYRHYKRYRCSTHFPAHRCIRTNILSLHKSYPGNGSQYNLFSCHFLQLPIPKTRLSLIPLLFYISSDFLTVPSYKSSARTPRKTLSSVVKNACLLVRYLAIDILLLNACVAGMCLPTRCLAMGIHVTL